MPTRPGNLDSFRPWVEALASKGWGADKIYNYIRDFYGIVKGERSRVPRSFIRRTAVPLRQKIINQRRTFPKRADAILDERRAIKTGLKSPLGYRYLIQFEFETTNVITGKTEIVSNTIGAHEAMTIGDARLRARGRLERLNNRDFLFDSPRLAQLQQEDFIADLDSIQITGLLRTTVE